MTVATRLAGVLRQYPNPEVAFFTAEALMHVAGGRRGTSRTGYYLSGPLARGGRGGRAAVTAAEWETGREILARDIAGFIDDGAVTGLRDYMEKQLAAGQWYDSNFFRQAERKESLIPWVARLVNRWLKDEPTGADDAALLLEHYKDIRKLGVNLDDIADWALATHPDIMKFTLNQALHRSRRWHAAERRTTDAGKAPPSEVVYRGGPEEDPERWSIHALTTKGALEHEGTTQHHCVGGYWNDVVSGRTHIFSVRDHAGVSHATFEVRGDRLQQLKGPANRAVTKEDLIDVVNVFVYETYDAPFGRPRADEEHDEAEARPDDEAEPMENPQRMLRRRTRA